MILPRFLPTKSRSLGALKIRSQLLPAQHSPIFIEDSVAMVLRFQPFVPSLVIGTMNLHCQPPDQAAQPFSPVTPLFAGAEPPLLTGVFAHREGSGGAGGGETSAEAAVGAPWAGDLPFHESVALLDRIGRESLKSSLDKFTKEAGEFHRFFELKIEKEDSPMAVRAQSALESVLYNISVISASFTAALSGRLDLRHFEMGGSGKILPRDRYVATLDYVKWKTRHSIVEEMSAVSRKYRLVRSEGDKLQAPLTVLKDNGFEIWPIEGMIHYLRGEEGKLQSRYNELREAARSLDEAAFIEFKTTNSL